MARRRTKRLTARTVETLKAKVGKHPDGEGLYLVVGSDWPPSWVYRYRLHGRRPEMGLGPLSSVSLAEARELAEQARRLVSAGHNPIEVRQTERIAAAVSSAKAMTFADCAKGYIDDRKAAWSNEKHRAQWNATLETYAFPVFGHLPVSEVDVGLVLKVLRPIWSAKPETASRLRGRIEAVLSWAKVSGFRRGDNPAAWRGNLDHLLPRRAKVRAVQHHPALPHTEIGAFMCKLRAQRGTAARALEFLVLTAARTSEVTHAKFKEFDAASARWTVPAVRMKGGREHRVPLSKPALAVIEAQRKAATGLHVFPGGRHGKPLSIGAMRMTLRRMGYGDCTVHGFRSAFRDWAAEATTYPREVVEAALAHVVGDKTEAAYLRSDLLDRRARLMDDWGRYCRAVREVGDVVPIVARTV